jgi:hypothetical protein
MERQLVLIRLISGVIGREVAGPRASGRQAQKKLGQKK